MRIGLFGAGRIGEFHAGLLQATDGVKQLVVYDPDARRREEVAQRVGAEAVDSPEALVGSGVDAAVIASPTSTHADSVHRCVAAGLPTFCEKPVALSLEQLRTVVAHVGDSDAIVQVGFQRRFDAGYREARQLRESGALGRVYSFRMAGHDPAPPPRSYIESSGGIFRDLHIHDFDILRFVLGQEVEEVYAQGAVLGFDEIGEAGDVDTDAVLLRMVDGTLGVLTGGRHDPLGYDVRMEVFGSADSVAVGLDERVPLRSVEPGMRAFQGPPWPDFQHRFAAAYREELATFVRVAQGEVPNPCTVADAYQALRIAAAADLSLAEHRPVRLEEVQ